MGIYIFLIVISLFFDFLQRNNVIKKNHSKYILAILCIVFTLVSALRHEVGTDYRGTYTKAFFWLKNGLFYNFEFLFLQLNYLVIRFNGNLHHLMAICSALTIPAFFYFIKKNVDEKYWFLGVFLFIGTTVFYATMNVVRQYLGIALLLYAYPLLLEKKYVKFVLVTLVASLFHTSALFFDFLLICYFGFKRVFSSKSNIVILLIYFISLIGVFFDFRNIIGSLDFIIPYRYTVYIDSVFIKEKNMLAIIKIIFPNLLLLFSLKYKKEISKNNETLFPFFGVYAYTIISNMFYGINVFIRLTWYCDLFYIIFIPQLLKYIHSRMVDNKSSVNGYNFVSICIILYFILLNIYSIFISGGHGVIPYQSIFDIL